MSRGWTARTGLLLAWWGLAGCGGGNFASEISVRPNPHLLASRGEARIRLPADERFSIALAPSRQSPGLGGTASAKGTARPDGTADASAGVVHGGEAECTLQIGHAFRNDTEQQLDLEVAASVAYEYTAELPTDAVGVTLNVGVRLYARNSRNLLVRNYALVAHSTDDGSASRQGQEKLRFTIALAPGETVTLFVAGQAAVKTEFGKSAACRLELKQTEMEVTTRAAEAAPSSAPAGGG